VLDIASGTGDVSFALARAKRPAHIQLTDLVPEMLEIAKKRYAEGASKDTPFAFEVVDAQQIPYPNDSFDVVTVAYGLRNMPDRERALREMFRVLKPGGTLVCLEFSRPHARVVRALYHFYLKHLIPFWGGLITKDREGFVYLSDSIKAFPDQKQFASLFSGAGFTQVEWVDFTGGIAAVHTGVKPG
jgi:demethylmenaquinone methyltransferase/2-methoxy-6-polyprenyl-1,4-benzoquinol methylase